MPRLPSGLKLAVSSHLIIEQGINWFRCPEGHFWIWCPGKENGPPPYSADAKLLMDPLHFPAPRSRDEVKNFICVLEKNQDDTFGWRGEWLESFPKYTHLNASDMEAWQEWVTSPEIEEFLDETMEKCVRFSQVAKRATGIFNLKRS